MKVSRENIIGLIPHRHPFIMIDNLLDASPTSFQSDFLVRTENIFVENNVLQASALIENIAQTCAAGFGYLQSANDGEPGMGFIGAISKLKVHALPAVESLIRTTAEVTHQLANVFLIKGENYCDGKIILECELKIVII
ncbi:MAG: hypothetical protein JJE25_09825 [Bacteroidia bacterium]|nr:hypothetical protein [Bacteroidia bacterium]